MEGNGKLLTIPEAATFTGKSVSGIYKHIKRGILQVEHISLQGKQIKKIKKDELVRVYGISYNNLDYDSLQVEQKSLQIDHDSLQENKIDYNILQENMKKVIEEYFKEKETALIKPLEQQAIFKAGELNKENQFLKARLETLIEENQELRESLKALPGPITEIKEKLEQQESAIFTLEKEKQNLQREKEEIIQKKEEQIQKLKEQNREQEARLKAEAEEQMKKLADAWKKELEQARRPWWKFW